MIFRNSKRTSRTHSSASRNREIRRRRLSRLVSHRPQVEALEDRRLLAVVGYTAGTDELEFTGIATQDVVDVSSPGASSLVITVGGADTITLADDAVANGDFVLTNSNQTLTIDTSSSAVNDFTASLDDGTDLFTFTNDISAEIGGNIQINGGDGNDVLDARLAGKGVIMRGDLNDDILQGSEFADNLDGGGHFDMLFGNGGDDALIENTELVGGDADVFDGGAGNDFLEGFSGDETFIGGPGDDTIRGLGGNDLIIWNNGDGNDMVDGGSGVDTQQINLNDGLGDTVTVSDGGAGRLDFTRANGGAGLGPFSLDIGTTEVLDVNALAGDDTATVADLSAVADLATLNIDLGDGGGDVINIDGDPDSVSTATAETTNLDAIINSPLTLVGNGVVQSGSTLGGSGPIVGPVDVQTGGIVAPGNSPGILSTGSINFLSGSTLDVEVDALSNPLPIAGTDYDQLDVTGSVSIDAAANLNLIDNLAGSGNGVLGDTLTLINNDGADAITGTFAGFANGSDVAFDGDLWRIFYDGGDGNDLVLTYVDLTNIYVNDDFTAGNGFNNGDVVADADPNTAGNQIGVIGVNAFSTIQAGVDAVNVAGTVNVTDDLSTDGPGNYIENVSIGKNLTILGTEGDPTAVVVDGNAAGSVFTIGSNTVVINSITIQNGSTAGNGGGINNAGTLMITNSVVQNNTATNGGGIFNSNTLTADGGSTISGNTATEEGGGLWNSTGTATIDSTTISGNTASAGNNGGNDQGGGGVFNNGGTLDIDNATISGNTATVNLGNGGGLMTVGGIVTIDNSTIDGNMAARAGGGLENNNGDVTLTTVGFDGNDAGINGGGVHVSGAGTTNVIGGGFFNNTAAQEGGGLWNGSGVMTIVGANINSNTASGAGADQGGGGVFNASGTVNINGAQILQNVADGTSGSGGGILNDAGGTLMVNASAINFNTSNRAGGGIETTTGTIVTITGGTLSNNNTGVAPAAANPGNGGGLHVSGSATVDISNGVVADNVAASEGGGLWNGSGTMTITNMAIVRNTASGASADQGGGGVFNAGGTVDIFNSNISDNVADGTSGSGGGILNDASGTVTVTQSTISGNTANRAGGGIEATAGSSTFVDESTISANDAGAAPGNGGGVHISGAGAVDITNTTISGNTANEGGGLWNSGVGTLTLTNSTVSGNSATGSDGGGIFNTDGGSITTDSVTITLNDASTGVGSGVAGGTGGVILENTIVAQNPGAGTEENLSGTIDSLDFNLIGDADDGTLTGFTVNTIFGGDALLLALANNGGLTETHLPAAGSPAIGFGTTVQTLDQRGATRPQGGQDDIGAVEVDLNGFVFDADDLAAGNAGDGNPDEFLIINDGGGLAGNVQIFINSILVDTQLRATTGLIVIRGSADDDMLTIDNSNGLIGANVVFDGDGTGGPVPFPTQGGFDVLRLIGSTPTTTTYNPGQTADAGAVFQENNQVTQRIQFFGLEPVQVVGTGAGDTLNVAAQALGVGFPQALNADNAINYSEGPNSNDPVDPVFAGAITGLVTVDGFESLEFAAFGTLNIDAGSGSDEVSLSTSVEPTDLATINLIGGDPTAGSDIAILSGTIANDDFVFAPTSNDTAVVTDGGPVTINLSGVEAALIDGEGGVDTLVYASPAGNDLIDLVSAGNGSEASISAVQSVGGILMPLSYTNLFNLAGTLSFADDSGTRTDSLTVLGTPNDDAFSVSATGEVSATNVLGSLATPNILTPGVNSLRIAGLNGNDSFDVPGDHPFDSLFIEGGQPDSGSDVLNFVGAGAAVNLDLAAQTITETGFMPVSYAGVETVNIDANSTLEVTGTANDDTFNVTPTTAGNDGLFDHSESIGVAFSYTDATTVTFNGAGGTADELNILGDAVNDTITSAASAVTVDGSTVTLGTGLESLQVLGLGGNDDINLSTLVFTGIITLRGGDGNDLLTGSPQDDISFGGAGDDTLVGGGGDDVQYGEDGNDVFGNPTLTADGTADDPGTDRNFGGNGFDNFVWEPGDGTDFNNGGDDAADIFRFFGRAGSDNFTLQSGGTPTHLNALFNGAVIDLHGVEDVIVDPLGDDDVIVVSDLFATEAVNVTIVAGGGAEAITVNGRTTDDNLQVTSLAGNVAIEGLTYDVNISGPDTADTLEVNSGEGDDSINVADGVELLITSTVVGGVGNDSLSGAFNTAFGRDGDDLIVGADNDQTIDAGAGEDTIVGGAGNDTIDGGGDFDTILIEGTSGPDIIDVLQVDATTLNFTVNAVADVDTLVAGSVEEARVVAGSGADLIRVNWGDALTATPVDAVRMTVDGGADSTSDRLVVVDDGANDLVLYRKGQQDASGTVQIRPAVASPLLAVFTGIENIDFVDNNGNVIDNSGGSQLVVFKHDPFESNDNRFTATYLGSGDVINVDPTIDPGPLTDPFGDGQNLIGDSDYYRVVAETTGTLDFQVYFRQIAGLPNNGDLDINVRDSAGDIIANFGVNDATDDERVRIPAVQGQTYYLEVFGAAGTAINVYNITVVNAAPPTPYALELLDNPADGTTNPPGTSVNSDTGRSQFDNITYDSTPTLYFRLDDGIFLYDLPGNPGPGTPPDEVIDIPFQAGLAQPIVPGFAIAIFDEGNTPPQTGTPPQDPLGFATAVAGQDGIYAFTVPAGFELSEGSHFLSARVQMIDPATAQQTGFGPRSDTLEIVVDRTPPEVVFGLAAEATDGLHPDSDSGIGIADRITNDLTPTFFGRAEANSIVRAYVDLDNSSTLTAADLLIGQTVAIPLDGTEQLETPLDPAEPGGQWQLTSTVSMNDPRIVAILGTDGLRRILVTGEDVAGNITPADAAEILEIFVDTQGPQVTDVFITAVPGFDLFTLKPDTPQPTPRVDSLTISLQDLPARVAPFFYGVVGNDVPPLAPIVLVGDHSGVIASTVTYNAINIGPGIATGEIILTFNSPLPDDRFTLTLTDNIVDPAGNPLDGENNAAEPVGSPDFPTGDGIPGGDFIARFTIDSRPEIATWSQGVVYADINGNFVWDPEGQDNDATNRDFVFNFGEITDAYFAGNFSSVATSSGFDKIGAYGRFNGVYQFFLDTDDDGVGDLVPNMAFQVNAVPVAGNFFNSAADIAAVAAGQRPRDEIGAYDGENWYLDVNGNNQIDAGERFPTDLRGIPLVGDFNGDGFDDLATFNNDTGVFQFDLDRDGDVDDTLIFGFPGFGEKPVAGDVNLDGIDDIVLWVPGQEGQLPKNAGEFHFLVSDNAFAFAPNPPVAPVVGALPSNVFGQFSPAPLGNDLIAQFGDEFALPLLGNFDPPVVSNGGSAPVGSLTNLANPFDTNVDGRVTALDALVVINALGRGDFDQSASALRVVASLGGFQLDASGDGDISSLDALQVINELARQNVAEGESLDESQLGNWATAADSAIAEMDDDDDDLLALLAADLEQQRVKS